MPTTPRSTSLEVHNLVQKKAVPGREFILTTKNICEIKKEEEKEKMHIRMRGGASPVKVRVWLRRALSLSS
jgi:hypothetical protein